MMHVNLTFKSVYLFTLSSLLRWRQLTLWTKSLCLEKPQEGFNTRQCDRHSSSSRNVQSHRLKRINKGSIGGGQRADGKSLQPLIFWCVILGQKRSERNYSGVWSTLRLCCSSETCCHLKASGFVFSSKRNSPVAQTASGQSTNNTLKSQQRQCQTTAVHAANTLARMEEGILE